MISAAEALALPRARLSPSDAEAVQSYLVDIEKFIRENMRRVNCIMPVDPKRVNETIAAEIERVLRSGGWNAAFQKVETQSPLGGKSVGFQLMLVPMDASYTKADEIIAQSGN